MLPRDACQASGDQRGDKGWKVKEVEDFRMNGWLSWRVDGSQVGGGGTCIPPIRDTMTQKI